MTLAFHDDLLSLAVELVHKDPSSPKQVSLRRAVSTAYYALFHLLISETIANWSRASSRNTLGRMFDHGRMKTVSKRFSETNKAPFKGENPAVVQNVSAMAKTFVQLQDKRIIADYDNATFWTPTQAKAEVKAVEKAFIEWKLIRDEEIAQKYLVSLLIKPRD